LAFSGSFDYQEARHSGELTIRLYFIHLVQFGFAVAKQ
jgi:hypothetical protein